MKLLIFVSIALHLLLLSVLSTSYVCEKVRNTKIHAKEGAKCGGWCGKFGQCQQPFFECGGGIIPLEPLPLGLSMETKCRHYQNDCQRFTLPIVCSNITIVPHSDMFETLKTFLIRKLPELDVFDSDAMVRIVCVKRALCNGVEEIKVLLDKFPFDNNNYYLVSLVENLRLWKLNSLKKYVKSKLII